MIFTLSVDIKNNSPSSSEKLQLLYCPLTLQYVIFLCSFKPIFIYFYCVLAYVNLRYADVLYARNKYKLVNIIGFWNVNHNYYRACNNIKDLDK